MNHTFPSRIVLVGALASALGACSSLYYSAMEAMGTAKRELLVGRVVDARETQTEAKEQIQTTFEAFKSLTGFDGGELETKYETLNAELERAQDAAAAVGKRIRSIEDVSSAMFSEWAEEIEQIENPDLRRKSEQLKGDTQRKYDKLVTSMRAAESRMPPVLTAFKDQVLFLKHNLNAQAISSLQDEVIGIESNVDQLIAEMQRSIEEANAFIETLEPSS